MPTPARRRITGVTVGYARRSATGRRARGSEHQDEQARDSGCRLAACAVSGNGRRGACRHGGSVRGTLGGFPKDVRARARGLARRLVLATRCRLARSSGPHGTCADVDGAWRALPPALARNQSQHARRGHRQRGLVEGPRRHRALRPLVRRHGDQRRGRAPRGPHRFDRLSRCVRARGRPVAQRHPRRRAASRRRLSRRADHGRAIQRQRSGSRVGQRENDAPTGRLLQRASHAERRRAARPEEDLYPCDGRRGSRSSKARSSGCRRIRAGRRTRSTAVTTS